MRFEQWLERAGEYLNPILIKESRQALKSRQFTITFALVLGASWCWSFLGIALIGPQVYYGAHGPDLLLGYAVILLFAPVIVVPYIVFRSLAGELEDHSYELLSITSLKATANHRRQVGHELSANPGVFVSDLPLHCVHVFAPRGRHPDDPDAGRVLDLGLAGLFTARAAAGHVCDGGYRQVVASVMLVLALGGLFLAGCGVTADTLRSPPAMELRDFFLGVARCLPPTRVISCCCTWPPRRS